MKTTTLIALPLLCLLAVGCGPPPLAEAPQDAGAAPDAGGPCSGLESEQLKCCLLGRPYASATPLTGCMD